MGAVSAADLPDGSVIADSRHAYIKTRPSPTAAWTSTNGGWLHDKYVQEAIDAGAQVLRHGPGKETA